MVGWDKCLENVSGNVSHTSAQYRSHGDYQNTRGINFHLVMILNFSNY